MRGEREGGREKERSVCVCVCVCVMGGRESESELVGGDGKNKQLNVMYTQLHIHKSKYAGILDS